MEPPPEPASAVSAADKSAANGESEWITGVNTLACETEMAERVGARTAGLDLQALPCEGIGARAGQAASIHLCSDSEDHEHGPEDFEEHGPEHGSFDEEGTTNLNDIERDTPDPKRMRGPQWSAGNEVTLNQNVAEPLALAAPTAAAVSDMALHDVTKVEERSRTTSTFVAEAAESKQKPYASTVKQEAPAQGLTPGLSLNRTLADKKTSLADKVAKIKESLQLDGSLAIPAAIAEANKMMGLEAQGKPLPKQADALLEELGV